MIGPVNGIRLVNKAGVILQAGEAVGETGGNMDDMPVLRRKFDPNGFSISRMSTPQVQDDVHNSSRDAIDQLLVGVGGELEMHSTHYSGGRRGIEFLLYEKLDSEILELPLMQGFDKKPAGILEDEWFENADPGERFGDEFHEPVPECIFAFCFRPRNRNGWI